MLPKIHISIATCIVQLSKYHYIKTALVLVIVDANGNDSYFSFLFRMILNYPKSILENFYIKCVLSRTVQHVTGWVIGQINNGSNIFVA